MAEMATGTSAEAEPAETFLVCHCTLRARNLAMPPTPRVWDSVVVRRTLPLSYTYRLLRGFYL